MTGSYTFYLQLNEYSSTPPDVCCETRLLLVLVVCKLVLKLILCSLPDIFVSHYLFKESHLTRLLVYTGYIVKDNI